MTAIAFESTTPTPPTPITGDVTASVPVPSIRVLANVWDTYSYQIAGLVSARGQVDVAGYAEVSVPEPSYTAGYVAVPFSTQIVVHSDDVVVEESLALADALSATRTQSATLTDGITLGDLLGGIAVTTYNFEADEQVDFADLPGIALPPISMADGAGFADTLAALQSYGFHAADGAVFNDAVAPSLVHLLRDNMTMADQPTALLDALGALGDTVTFADVAAVAYRALMSETITLAGDAAAWRQVVLDLADALALTAGLRSTWDASVALASALALGDSLTRSIPGALADSVVLTDAQQLSVRAMVRMLDSMRLQDTLPAPSLTVTALVDEGLVLDAALSAGLTLRALLADGVQFLAQIALDDGVYLAWVVNTTSRAFTSYSNYPFNSFATIADKTHGAKSDGIYLLEGPDDAGAAIEAFARGGLTDLGTSKLKRFPSAYLGIRTDGRMVLKATVVDDDGVRQEHWYGMEQRPAAAMRTSRVKLGRGLKSTYWGWELANVDGADFALDVISWYPLVLDRRL